MPELTLDDFVLSGAGKEPPAADNQLSYRHAVDAARHDIIKRALAQTQGNRAAAARLLGMHKTHLINLIKSLQIE